MKKLHFKLPNWKTILGLVVLGGILIFNQVVMVRHFPKNSKELVLDRNIALLEATNSQTPIAQLRKGDKVKYLGVVKAESKCPCGLVVETANGERGLLSTVDMGYPQMLADSEDKTCITIKRVFWEKNHPEYEIIKANGEKETVDMYDVRPVLPPDMRNLIIKKSGDYYMTRGKFENLYIGSSMAENDARYRPALHIDKVANGWKAYYPNLEIITDGKVRNPIITYDAKGIATGFTWEENYVRRSNEWLLMLMPFIYSIADNDFLARFIEIPLYTNMLIENDEYYGEGSYKSTEDIPTICIIGIFSYFIFGIIWILLMGTLPSLILDASLYCRHLYFHLPDWILQVAFVIIGLVCTYIWIALMAIWGCFWMFLPVIAVFGIISAIYSIRHLNMVPHDRCEQCRRMNTMEFVKTEYTKIKPETRKKSVARNVMTETWKTWTERERWEGSDRKADFSDIKKHTKTTTEYDDYDVKCLVQYKIDFYKCSVCGYIEEAVEELVEEVSRTKTGEHTEVTENTSYTNDKPTESERAHSSRKWF